jgi:hypothetical protein
MRRAGSVLGERSAISREAIADTPAITGLKSNIARSDKGAPAGSLLTSPRPSIQDLAIGDDQIESEPEIGGIDIAPRPSIVTPSSRGRPRAEAILSQAARYRNGYGDVLSSDRR